MKEKTLTDIATEHLGAVREHCLRSGSPTRADRLAINGATIIKGQAQAIEALHERLSALEDALGEGD